MKIYFSVIVLFLILITASAQQITKVRGKVVDAETSEALPFVNIIFIGTSQGAITDFEGNFYIETRYATDSLQVSFVGYKEQTFYITKGIYQNLNIKLSEEINELETVVIKPGENPAHPILKNIIRNKDRNNYEKIESYNCHVYNKIQIDMNNITDKFKETKLLEQFKFVFENIDTSAITGKAYLPLMISETMSQFYYRSNPLVKREVIYASQISGFKNKSISQLTGNITQVFNVYDNFMTFYESGFVSPISDGGLSYYKYYLTDSSNIDGIFCYNLSFKPQRKQERTFSGNFWVAKDGWALKRIQMRLSPNANLNFINDLVVNYEYAPVFDSIWVLQQEDLLVDFNIAESKRIKGFFGRKTAKYTDFSFSEKWPDNVSESPVDVIILEDAIDKKQEYWDTLRPVQLSDKELKVYQMVDSIKNVPMFRTFSDVLMLLSTYYYVWGYFEIGPYFSTYSTNDIEGNRFRIGGRTSNKFSTKVMYEAYTAYGTLDDRLKYGGNVLYMFSKNPRIAWYASVKKDMEQLGQSVNAFRSDNIMVTLLKRNPFYKLTLVDEYKTSFEREWYQGFTNKLTLLHRTLHPTVNIPFNFDPVYQENTVKNIKAAELTLLTHYAYKERFLMGEFERTSLGTKYPELNLYLTAGFKDVFGSDFKYFKINLNIYHYINTNPFGYFKYSIDAGRIFGKLPYPLLELHRGNETYAYDYYSFNMMNYYEFVSDKYVSLIAEQHFQGFFLNHIPLLRKLKWREVASARGIIGRLDDQNRNYMFFPEGLGELKEPYYEASVGIENIFKVFRIDACWRLSYLNHANIQPFGLRVLAKIII